MARRPLRFPFLDHDGPIAFAHRGGAGDFPENTMPAFANAVAMGYRYLETDVHATSDGVLVAFHDDDLERTCGRPGLISQLPWSEVARARVAGVEPIPRLVDLFEAFPQAMINIDCKADPAVQPLIDTLRRADAVDRVCVGAFAHRRLTRIRRAFTGGICTSMSPVEVAAWLAGWVMPTAACAQVPVSQGRVTIVTRRHLAAAHRRDVPVHVWTIDDPLEMDRLLDLGVDGIMTDRPAMLRELLEKRGQWTPR
jgi:glycerophosphoryl diester phosphodiesterase